MKQEDKELLLKDLCARLPYGVKVEHLLHAPNNPSELFSVDVDKQVLYCDHKGREEWYKVNFIKPYLRPMSSMTEEEEKEYHSIQSDIWKPCGTQYYDNWRSIDWLNKNMFDYHGLIPKGLAIAVTKENNPYNKK